MTILDVLLIISCALWVAYLWVSSVAFERTVAERDYARKLYADAIAQLETVTRDRDYWQREATARRDDVRRHVGAGE